MTILCLVEWPQMKVGVAVLRRGEVVNSLEYLLIVNQYLLIVNRDMPFDDGTFSRLSFALDILGRRLVDHCVPSCTVVQAGIMTRLTSCIEPRRSRGPRRLCC